MHHIIAICEFKLDLVFGNAQIEAIARFLGFYWCRWWYLPDCNFMNKNILFWPLWPLPLTSGFDLLHDITSVTGNYFMMIQWKKHCEKGVTDIGQMDKNFHSIAWICYGRIFNEFYLSIWNQSVFQSKASAVCSVTTAVFIDFCLKKLYGFSQHIGKKKTNIQIPQNNSQGTEMLI